MRSELLRSENLVSWVRGWTTKNEAIIRQRFPTASETHGRSHTGSESGAFHDSQVPYGRPLTVVVTQPVCIVEGIPLPRRPPRSSMREGRLVV